jgi:MFS family permease
VSEQAWLLNGTPLGLAAVLLVAGSLADDYGRRRAFLIGTVAMSGTTALGALAPSTLTFTLSRIALGAASALIIASSLGLIAQAYPAGHARIRAMGVWGASVSGGIATGPLIAGGLAGISWRLGYAVFAAAGLLVAVVAARSLGESKNPRGRRPDLYGALTLGTALTTLLSALTLGRDGWLRAPVALLFVATVLLIAAFARVEHRGAAPMIDLALLRQPLFLASLAGAFFTGLGVIGMFSYLSALLQQTLGMSAMGTAWIFFLWAGAAFFVALQARRLTTRISARHQLTVGFVLAAAGAFAMLGAVPAGSWPRLLPGVVISGAGSGLLNAALPRLAVDSVPAERAAMGSGANNTARYIGSATGVALTIAVATAHPGRLAQGTDTALLISAILCLTGAFTTLLLRERR